MILEVFVKQYSVCQQAKVDHTLPPDILQPLPFLNKFGMILLWISSVVCYPHMVIVDRLCKYGHFILLKVDFNSKILVEAFTSKKVISCFLEAIVGGLRYYLSHELLLSPQNSWRNQGV